MCKWTAWQLLSECWWREGNKRPLTVAAGIFQVLSVHSHMDSALDSCTEGGRLVFARWWGTTRQSPTLCEEEAAFLLTCTVSAAPGLCPAHSGMWKEQSLFGPLPLLAEGRQCGRIMSGLLQPGHFRSCSLAQRSRLARTTISEWILNPPAWGRESRHFDNIVSLYRWRNGNYEMFIRLIGDEGEVWIANLGILCDSKARAVRTYCLCVLKRKEKCIYHLTSPL